MNLRWYYRRISLANQRYSTATIRGYKTDRGRVLVLLKPMKWKRTLWVARIFDKVTVRNVDA
jgi:GWxTD domain-containing protein